MTTISCIAILIEFLSIENDIIENRDALSAIAPPTLHSLTKNPEARKSGQA